MITNKKTAPIWHSNVSKKNRNNGVRKCTHYKVKDVRPGLVQKRLKRGDCGKKKVEHVN